jgi:hypothetical protein
MFWVSFFTTMYWFIFYKMQKNAKLLLPSTVMLNYAYNFFNAFALVILILQTLACITKVLIQVNADIFVMDWEKPKNQYFADGRAKGYQGTVCWRSLFVANELNELQVGMRKIKPETTLIWFAFFWVAIGWQYIS